QLSPSLLGVVLLEAGPALCWIWRRPLAYGRHWRQTGRNAAGTVVGLLLAVGVVLAGYQAMASLMRNHKPLRYMINPLNSVYAATRLAA
ncbi:DUF1705 domain-containing protein, partial [Escherichia coli]|uniref:phosphoethanolamine transferase domain-containing protein n=1 Tax=Escherichia coli TaxID=562 RepID=UPI0015BE3874